MLTHCIAWSDASSDRRGESDQSPVCLFILYTGGCVDVRHACILTVFTHFFHIPLAFRSSALLSHVSSSFTSSHDDYVTSPLSCHLPTRSKRQQCDNKTMDWTSIKTILLPQCRTKTRLAKAFTHCSGFTIAACYHIHDSRHEVHDTSLLHSL